MSENNSKPERSQPDLVSIRGAFPSSNAPNLDLASIRQRLDKSRGRDYWRSLDEIAATDGFQDFLHREFPRQASEWLDDEGRRNFLKLMGASLALAGMSACTRQPTELIMPYVIAPESVIPGRPQFYATAFTLGGLATGVLMESHMGRPTKVEGNPQHPASLGATDAMTQASVLNLYDPDRSQTVDFLGEVHSYGSFLLAFRKAMKFPDVSTEPPPPAPEGTAPTAPEPKPQQPIDGSGIRILTETVVSPTLAAQLKETLRLYTGSKWYQYEPLGAQGARGGSNLAFGQYVNTIYRFDAADVVLSLDADFLGVGPTGVRYARDFASKRKVRGDQTTMNRLYAVETTPTNSGAKADHRIAIKPSQMADFARALAGAVGAGGGGSSPVEARWFNALVKDLQAHRGASIVIAGEQQTPEIHALVHAINGALGNAGKTVTYTDAVEANPVDQLQQLQALANDLDSGTVELLVIVGGNPAFNAPPDLYMRDKILKAKLRVRLGLYEDETSELCQWHVPEAHALETWSDARAFDGTATIMQPLIAPLYQGRSAHEFLAAFTDTPEKSGYDLIREYWQKQHPGADFEDWWKRSVHDGVVADTALPAKTMTAKAPPAGNRVPPGGSGALEISFHPDPYIYDGRFANNGWLQELPRPISKLTWDNAALISPATAKRLGVTNEDRVELKLHNRHVLAAVWIQPGQPNDSVAVNLGFGRTRSGRAGNGAGFDAYPLRPSYSQTFATGLELRKTGKKFKLAATQHHYMIDGTELEGTQEKKRGVVRSASISEYREHPDFAQELIEDPAKQNLTMYPVTFKYEGYKWGMTIDQTACVGCNACVAACQSENNIAVVGKEQVLNTREMHWIRIDRYFQGSVDAPAIHFQPVPCMQCEDAPCELVCPVAATNHDQDGINTMVYNRCVGTRYCSNNCPWKVRRFNFLLFSDWNTESIKLQKNPDVTVRSRGVMEKCTYCIQRISSAKITAEKEGRRIHDGEIATACEAA
ncbi:MAG: TAT-variant-translocated molybdopterin oxidoreductase, partial [Acidobacteriota bacterium]|nr:TAT-variant-translocated molybdopterin oxidoreductase [Acidobacteriota bacterium]